MSDEIKNQTEKKDKETIQNNSEILFLYDAKMCNPNGDPDDENKPRMDYDRGINLVSDVRLKRYIRDYLMDYKDQTIFVSKVNRETVDATGRLKKLIELYKQEIESNEVMKKDLFDRNGPNEKNLAKHLEWLLSKLIDVRFFGATMPLKSEVGKGASITFTGPIQFNWGYSLNKVTGPMESNTITSTFAGAGDEHSTMGKDYRVNYSLIAFHGIISAKRAKITELKTADINLFDEAIVQAIPLEATTRSKTGQSPVLYIRVNYNTSEYFLGDMRKYVKIIDKNNNEITFDDTSKLRSTADYKLDLSELCAKLGNINDKILQIHFWKDENLKINGWVIQKGNEKKNSNEMKLKIKSKGGSEIEILVIELPKPKEIS